MQRRKISFKRRHRYKSYRKTCNKNVQLALQHCCEQVEKLYSAFSHPHSNLSCNKSGRCKLREYWLLIGSNYAEVTPYTGVTSLAAQQVCLGPVKRASCTDFVPKSRTTLYRHFLQQIFATCLTWVVARQVWTWLAKRATSLFNSFCGNVAKQVARFCCPVLPHNRRFVFLGKHLHPRNQKDHSRSAPLRLDLYCCSPFLLPEEIKNIFAQRSITKSQSLQNRLEHIPDQLDFPKGRRQQTRINGQMNIW